MGKCNSKISPAEKNKIRGVEPRNLSPIYLNVHLPQSASINLSLVDKVLNFERHPKFLWNEITVVSESKARENTASRYELKIWSLHHWEITLNYKWRTENSLKDQKSESQVIFIQKKTFLASSPNSMLNISKCFYADWIFILNN